MIGYVGLCKHVWEASCNSNAINAMKKAATKTDSSQELHFKASTIQNLLLLHLVQTRILAPAKALIPTRTLVPTNTLVSRLALIVTLPLSLTSSRIISSECV